MKSLYFTCFALFILAGCKPSPTNGPNPPADTTTGNFGSLVEARKGFQSKLTRRPEAKSPVDEPPPGVFRKIQYDSPVGKLAAYLTPSPNDGKKHPAIIWITGGDCNSIGDVWSAQDPKDDQTASAFRKAQIVMMFPSLRGGNNNPGVKEGFFGEVDDVLAATKYLAKQEYVDPTRIYLGGHSTGGTLVLLVAECSDRYRAVFSFGPVEDVAGYGPKFNPYDMSNPKEVRLRSPGYWLESIQSPVFVIEGSRDGNLDSLQKMARKSQNAKVKFLPVRGADHFSTLASINRLLAKKILLDSGPATNLTLTEEELNGLFPR